MKNQQKKSGINKKSKNKYFKDIYTYKMQFDNGINTNNKIYENNITKKNIRSHPLNKNLKFNSKNYLTDTVLMIRPESFAFNHQTAKDNDFQNENNTTVNDNIIACYEFDEMVNTMKKEGINVIVVSSRKDIICPDAVFPNNWLVTLPNNKIWLFPMKNLNRRNERIYQKIEDELIYNGFKKPDISSLIPYEYDDLFLEGTGSIVFSFEENLAFAAISERTSEKVFKEFCLYTGFTPIPFYSTSVNYKPIYHTNVILSIGDGYIVIAKDNIHASARNYIMDIVNNMKKEVIEITQDQVTKYCGNILQLKNTKNEKLIIMSECARKGFTKKQLFNLEKYGKIISVNLNKIENIGGGSARCMITQIFLQKT
jgi:hypothetical protein